jgi:hypothetical protein
MEDKQDTKNQPKFIFSDIISNKFLVVRLFKNTYIMLDRCSNGSPCSLLERMRFLLIQKVSITTLQLNPSLLAGFFSDLLKVSRETAHSKNSWLS